MYAFCHYIDSIVRHKNLIKSETVQRIEKLCGEINIVIYLHIKEKNHRNRGCMGSRYREMYSPKNLKIGR